MKERILFSGPRLVRTFFLLVLLGILAACSGDLDLLRPDTILFNGKIVTVDEEFSIRPWPSKMGAFLR